MVSGYWLVLVVIGVGWLVSVLVGIGCNRVVLLLLNWYVVGILDVLCEGLVRLVIWCGDVFWLVCVLICWVDCCFSCWR